ncbi:hypothetical protein [Nocardia sp. GAS34]|uniref:hypothetical protein n=1 Tax=unclassified Nocardia TaxID=2637762 RepID=UPI003D24E387
MRVLKAEPGDDLAPAVGNCERRSGDAWAQAQALIERIYLSAGVNPVVRGEFTRAMTMADNDSIHTLHARFRAYTALLTHAPEVLTAFNRQPARPACATPLASQRRLARDLHS